MSELKWESFHALGELESLDFADTAFSDEKLDHLSRLGSLRRLGLDKTAVTDAALSELRSFPHLKTVSLNDTPVTEDGVLLFHQSYPQVRVTARHLDFSDDLSPLQDQPHDAVF